MLAQLKCNGSFHMRPIHLIIKVPSVPLNLGNRLSENASFPIGTFTLLTNESPLCYHVPLMASLLLWQFAISLPGS